jgi:hypothetical protein
MTSIDGFDEDIAEELRARAKDALLTLAIASEEQLGDQQPARISWPWTGWSASWPSYWPAGHRDDGRPRRAGRG